MERQCLGTVGMGNRVQGAGSWGSLLEQETIHTLTHTHTRMHTHTRTHTHSCTNTHTHTHSHTPLCMHTLTLTHTRHTHTPCSVPYRKERGSTDSENDFHLECILGLGFSPLSSSRGFVRGREVVKYGPDTG